MDKFTTARYYIYRLHELAEHDLKIQMTYRESLEHFKIDNPVLLDLSDTLQAMKSAIFNKKKNT